MSFHPCNPMCPSRMLDTCSQACVHVNRHGFGSTTSFCSEVVRAFGSACVHVTRSGQLAGQTCSQACVHVNRRGSGLTNYPFGAMHNFPSSVLPPPPPLCVCPKNFAYVMKSGFHPFHLHPPVSCYPGSAQQIAGDLFPRPRC